MLTCLRIRHFQAWEDTGPIRLAALTLFLGEHGTGKSSLGRAVAALQQPSPGLPAGAQIACAFDGGQPELRWPSGSAADGSRTEVLKPLAFVGADPTGQPLHQAPVAAGELAHWLQAMGLDPAHTGPSAQHARRLLSHLSAPHAGGTLWLEHPEVSLHPKAQAVLMDAFINAIQPGTDPGQARTQLIIETHSEAMLNRLQRRVAEGVIQPDDIALYVCRRPAQHANLETLRLSPYGDIENWPDDLFGHDMSDVVARTLAAVQRRQTDEKQRAP